MNKVIILILLLSSARIFGQATKLDSILAVFQQKKYQEALALAEAERKQVTGNKLASLDLVIGTCLCITNRDAGKGVKVLDRVLKNYKLKPAQMTRVMGIRSQCGSLSEGVALPELDVVDLVHNISEVRLRREGSGKIHFLTLEGQDSIVRIPYDSVQAVTPTHGRVFRLSEKAEAEAFFADLYEGVLAARHAISERFLIYTTGSISQSRLENLAYSLDSRLQLLADKFGFEAPPMLITIHIANTTEQARRLAKPIFGFDPGSGGWGFSSVENYAILAYIEGNPDEYQGTIQHELMHLLVNHNTSFPPWLSEGLPALYEATSNLEGVSNWRYTYVLKPYLSQEDHLPEDLLQMDWNAFEGITHFPDDSEPHLQIDRLSQAVNHATARHFALYLQNTGKLEAVVRAFADYQYGDPSFSRFADETEVLENATGKSRDELWRNFEEWVRKEN